MSEFEIPQIKKNILVYIINPIHVISSFSALKTMHNLEMINVTIIVHWPINNLNLVDEIACIIKQMTGEFIFIRNIIPISFLKKKEIISNKNLKNCIKDFKQLICIDHFEEIYYPHDIEGGMFQLICTAYPDAKRICSGEALGSVYDKIIHLSFLKKNIIDTISISQKIYVFLKSLYSLLKRLNKKKNFNIIFREYKANQAVLILPVDQSGYFLNNIPLTVCKKELFLDILFTCINNVAGLNHYINNLIQTFSNKTKVLILTENFAEGNFISFDKEIEMWCTIIRKYCPKDSMVILKAHPGEVFNRNEKICEKLCNDYQIIEVNKQYKRYPVELWKELIEQAEVICMSYPVLSLKYIYNKDVIQPMDHQFIEQWFEPWTWDSYKNALSLYMEPLKNLTTWDCASILYKGNIN